MKTTKTIFAVILTFALFVNLCQAGTGKYKLTASNLNYTSEKSLEFDIVLKNTSEENEPLKYFAGQFILEFNPSIANGGELTYSVIKTGLPEIMKPGLATVKDNQLRLSVNNIQQNPELMPLVPSGKEGLLIARMHLETSAEKFSSEPLNLKFNSESKLRTKITVFDGKKAVDITNSEFHVTDLDGSTGNGMQVVTEIPKEYSLAQNYPNPFNPTTKINYDLPKAGNVTMRVYDITGREVYTLVNQLQQAGSYSVTFNGANFASGIYFYKIQAGNFSQIKRMVLIK